MTIGLNSTLRNSRLDAITARAGGSALLRIYATPKPATGGAEALLLAQLTMNVTFAPAAAGGILTCNGITTQTSAANSGNAAWFRILKADATTHVLDGSVSTIAAGTGDLQLDDIGIIGGGTVAISQATFAEGNA